MQLPTGVSVHGVRKSNSGGNNKTMGYSLASKLASLDLSLGSGGGSANNSDNSLFCDPLLMNSYPPSHFVTQYITLQHSAGEQIYIADTRENGTSQV